jgi:hypothetical protein
MQAARWLYVAQIRAAWPEAGKGVWTHMVPLQQPAFACRVTLLLDFFYLGRVFNKLPGYKHT